jgi:flagellar assembly factor FliW
MQIETTRFGSLEIPDDAVLQFPTGIYGFEDAREFCLIPHDEAGRFHWLQSLTDPRLAMVVTDPFLFFPDYEAEVPTAAAEALRAETASDVRLLVTITVGSQPDEVCANLLGPFAVNQTSRLGMQLVQDSNRYNARHPLGDLNRAEQAA